MALQLHLDISVFPQPVQRVGFLCARNTADFALKRPTVFETSAGFDAETAGAGFPIDNASRQQGCTLNVVELPRTPTKMSSKNGVGASFPRSSKRYSATTPRNYFGVTNKLPGSG